ncbi:hypothetical protein EH223_10615 [candidate division KSB1 bacterium]|nr:hypothetical protein [candidate division KSB1 bacterium]RQW03207.1 MAG: hypothetical protein EH223_10615 [candidate division KSB1 bacterium]
MKYLIIACLFFFSCMQLLAAEGGLVSNVGFEQEDELIKIHYDLGGSNKTYKVVLSFSTANNTDYHYKPKSITGDIGKVTAGQGKEINWAYKQEFPQGLNVEELIFTVTAESYKNNMLYYLVGGGAAVLGIVAIIVTYNKDGASHATGSLAFDLPGEM